MKGPLEGALHLFVGLFLGIVILGAVISPVSGSIANVVSVCSASWARSDRSVLHRRYFRGSKPVSPNHSAFLILINVKVLIEVLGTHAIGLVT
jgi:hypothetical protein